MTPDELLAGPRGRRFCFEIAGGGRLDLGAVPPAPVAVDVDAAALASALAETTTWAMYWQEPWDTDVCLATAPWLEHLRPVAEAVLAHPATARWDAPLDVSAQHTVRFVDDRPAPEPVSLPEGATWAPLPTMDGPPAWEYASGYWWSNPGVDRTQTSGVGVDGTPVALDAIEDSPDWARAVTQAVDVVGSPRVLELVTPSDWTELVRSRPLDVTEAKRGDWWRTTGRDGTWLMPDWSAVATDWDAVHLTVGCYLRSAGRALAVDDDTASVLAGWGPDVTYWFADVLSPVGDPVDWLTDDDDDTAGRWRRA